MANDHRDLVITDLADEAAALRASLAEVAADRDAFRLLAHVAIAYIADLTTQNDRLQRRIAGLVDEVRQRPRAGSGAEAA